MGTHPIFESDFDCLTDQKWMNQKHHHRQKRHQSSLACPFWTFTILRVISWLKTAGTCSLGWSFFCLIKKNVDAYLLKLRDWWAVAQIKKDPDQFQHLEEDRLSRIERLQRELDAKAAAKKARQDEIDAARREREDAARENGGGRESMARWEAEQKAKTTTEPTKAHTIRDGPVKPPSKSKPRLRGEYNPMTGSGGGASRFKPNRAAPKRGG